MNVSFEYDRDYAPPFPVMEIRILEPNSEQSRIVTGLIDSGSDATQLPQSILRSVGARPTDRRWVRDLAGVRFAVSLYAVRLQIGDLILPPVEVVGRKGLEEVIIGRNVLNQLVVTLNGLAYVTDISN